MEKYFFQVIFRQKSHIWDISSETDSIRPKSFPIYLCTTWNLNDTQREQIYDERKRYKKSIRLVISWTRVKAR